MKYFKCAIVPNIQTKCSKLQINKTSVWQELGLHADPDQSCRVQHYMEEYYDDSKDMVIPIHM